MFASPTVVIVVVSSARNSGTLEGAPSSASKGSGSLGLNDTPARRRRTPGLNVAYDGHLGD
ncbi:MAG TPA: hypothetical protein VEH31_09625, partial [Streptosporangiaceae bacterium]|nr:hypothetical protein [Streptosporangiaceae bacterium]